MINPSKFGLFTIGIIIFLLAGCQEDIPDDQEGPVFGKVITVGSDFFSRIKRTVTNDGRVDNILDDYDCGEVVFPVSVTVNGEQITLESTEDIAQVRTIFEANDNDYDFVRFDFPISFINNDHTILTVESETQLDQLIQECERDYELEALTCVDYVYDGDPLGLIFITFDQAEETSENFQRVDDKEIFEFLTELEVENSNLPESQQEIASILFPIQVILEDGSRQTIRNGDDFDALLVSESTTDCFVPEGLVLDETTFRALLGTDDFVYKTYVENGTDRTAEFSGNVTTFNTDGTTNTNSTSTGAWSLERDFSNIEIDLDYSDTDLNAVFDRDWDLIQLNDLEFDVRFRNQLLTLRRVRATTPPELNSLFSSAGWQVINYTTTSGGDQTSLFNQRVFTFDVNGELRAAINNAGVEGTWQVLVQDQFDLSVNFTFEDVPPFTQIATNWRVLNYNDDRISLQLFNSGILEATLVFEKI